MGLRNPILSVCLAATLLTALARADVVILQNSCDYYWHNGCSPTSAGMVMGHYDRNGHDGLLYDEFMPGGVAESSTYGGGTFIANDTIDDLVYYMETSPSGGTPFYYQPDSSRLYVKTVYGWGPSYYNNSGMFGIYEYVDSCGYGSGNPSTDMNMFNQYIYGYKHPSRGFTFAGFMAEIDSGRPVMIHVDGHSMYAYGYDDSDETVYLHDTWRQGQHTMTWGGTYPHSSGDLQHYGVTVVHVTNGTPFNDPPVALDDSYFVDEDVELSVAAAGVLVNDYDPDEDPLSAFQYTQPSHGSVSLGADGSLQYMPETNYFGPDSFTYRAYDGWEYSEPATVDITIASINDAPVAVDDQFYVDEDTGLWVPPDGVLANDYDVDNEDLTIYPGLQPEHGAFALLPDGAVAYSPDENFFGTDTFTYVLYDGEEYSELATGTITVNPINDAPVAIDDDYSVKQNGSLWAPEEEGVAVNDYDVDSEDLTALLDQEPEHGNFALFENGSFAYAPDEDYYGFDSFTYYLDDGEDCSSIATATIMVLIPGDANGDLAVDDADASILASHWQMQSGATWADGDFNGDGKVDDADASILAGHWQESIGESVAPVPEPSILAGLLGIALAGGIWLTQRRKDAKG